MEIRVFDKELNYLGIVDDFSSCIWHTRFYEIGEAEILIEASVKNLQLLQKDFYLQRVDTKKSAMIIDEIEIKGDVEGDYITIKCSSLETLLKRRIIWNPLTSYNNQTIENIIRGLINDNIIYPTIQDRVISNFKLKTAKNYTEKATVQYTGKNLYEAISELCKTYGYGFSIVIDNKNFVFDLFKYTDRSIEQSFYPRVIFSKEFDNLTNSTYSFSKKDFTNVALVAGAGEGEERKRITVGNATGIDRYEVYVDNRDGASNDLTEEEYLEALNQDGEEALTKITEAFDSEVTLENNYEYGIDFNLGDRVTVMEWGMIINPRILEIIEKDDSNGYNIAPIFGQ